VIDALIADVGGLGSLKVSSLVVEELETAGGSGATDATGGGFGGTATRRFGTVAGGGTGT